MINFIENFYYRSPVFVQNIICSVYGLKLYRERYGGSWKIHYSDLLKSEKFEIEEIRRLQGKKFIELFHHACKNVPFYRDSYPVCESINYENWKNLLFSLPLLEKSTVRSSSEAFVSEYFDRKKLIKLSTSGTTGTPLAVYVAPEARKLNYAFYARSKRWAGVEGQHLRSATFAGRAIVPESQNHPPFWRRNIASNNMLFSSYHMSESSLHYYVNKLIKYQPEFIDSYPSSISLVADYCLAHNITNIRPKAVITSAETLFDHQRIKIESAFGCKVFDQYGCTEQAVFACQCKEGNYHVNPEFGLLEVVDKEGKPVPEGTVGEFVCTGFTNKAMPLIRYKVGDFGALSKDKCICGLNFQVVEQIFGRVDDLLITPSGKYIGRLDPVFKGVDSSIRETQIVQEAVDLVKINIVKDYNYKKEHGDFIVRELEKRMGTDIRFQIVFVDEIPKTQTGKFRTIVNKITGR